MSHAFRFLISALFVAAVSWPTRAHADEPEREVTYDPRAYPAPSTRVPTVLVGAATTAVWYGAAVGGSYLYPTARGADELRVPMAGPWMSLAQTGCPKTTPNCSTFWMVVGAVLKAFDGLGQAGGVLIMAEGLLLPTVEPGAKSSALSGRFVSARVEHQRSTFTFRPVPVASSDTLGLALVGNF